MSQKLLKLLSELRADFNDNNVTRGKIVRYYNKSVQGVPARGFTHRDIRWEKEDNQILLFYKTHNAKDI